MDNLNEQHRKWLDDLASILRDTTGSDRGAKAESTAKVKTAVRLVTGDFFHPDLHVVNAHPLHQVMIPEGEEVTVDLQIKNWDQAPSGTKIGWDVAVEGMGATAVLKVKSEDEAYLTLKGPTVGGTSVVNVQVTVKVDDQSVTFSFPAINTFVSGRDTSHDSDRDTNQGDAATAGQLDNDLTALFTTWEESAKTGISHFVSKQLENRIDELGAGSWASWAENFLGNTLWALTVFVPEVAIIQIVAKGLKQQAVRQFAISMVGIAVPAGLNMPNGSSVPTISQLHEMLDDHIMKVHQSLKQKLWPQAKKMIIEHPSMMRFEAIGKLVESLFVPGTVRVDPTYMIIPTVNESTVAARYERKATDMIQKYRDRKDAASAAAMDTFNQYRDDDPRR